MRIWTVHPRYLDRPGLLAAWREALLAQKVLQGQTKGYRHHPQLRRFQACASPVGAIAQYLKGLHDEASQRGYNFDGAKIAAVSFADTIACTRDQLIYEWEHLKKKLKVRDTARYSQYEGLAEPSAHPLFDLCEGPVETWEIVQ